MIWVLIFFSLGWGVQAEEFRSPSGSSRRLNREVPTAQEDTPLLKKKRSRRQRLDRVKPQRPVRPERRSRARSQAAAVRSPSPLQLSVNYNFQNIVDFGDEITEIETYPAFQFAGSYWAEQTLADDFSFSDYYRTSMPFPGHGISANGSLRTERWQSSVAATYTAFDSSGLDQEIDLPESFDLSSRNTLRWRRWAATLQTFNSFREDSIQSAQDVDLGFDHSFALKVAYALGSNTKVFVNQPMSFEGEILDLVVGVQKGYQPGPFVSTQWGYFLLTEVPLSRFSADQGRGFGGSGGVTWRHARSWGLINLNLQGTARSYEELPQTLLARPLAQGRPLWPARAAVLGGGIGRVPSSGLVQAFPQLPFETLSFSLQGRFDWRLGRSWTILNAAAFKYFEDNINQSGVWIDVTPLGLRWSRRAWRAELSYAIRSKARDYDKIPDVALDFVQFQLGVTF